MSVLYYWGDYDNPPTISGSILDTIMKISHLENNPYSKILLKVYRRLVYHPEAKIDNFRFLLFGYFDGMEYKEINTLDDYYNDDEVDPSILMNYEVYRLCLYSKDKDKKRIYNIFEEKLPPLIVISELKINSNLLFNTEKNNCLDEIKTIIYDEITKRISYKNISDINFSIFHSLSYSDFVVIFRGNDYHSIINLIEYLRSVSFNKSKSSLLNSTYSLTGVLVESMNRINDKKSDVLMQFSLKNTAGQDILFEKVSNSLDLKKNEMKIVFGKYDSELYLNNIETRKIVNLFNKKSILDPQQKLHKEVLGSSNTHWLLDWDPDLDHNHAQPQPAIDFNKIVNECDAFVKHKGSRKVFNMIFHYLLQISRNDASDPLLMEELLNIVTDFHNNGKTNWDKIINSNSGNKEEDIQLHHQDIQKGLEIITHLINSRVQSFRFYSEIPSYEIQFVRSATKLYLMYMNLVTDIEHKLNTLLDERKSNFFVTLGRFDKVSQTVIFPKIKNQLIAINLGIDSFCNIPYNLFLLLHEISHSIQSLDYDVIREMMLWIFCNEISSRIIERVLSGDDKLRLNQIFSNPDDLILLMKNKLVKFIHDGIIENSNDDIEFMNPEELIDHFWISFQIFLTPNNELIISKWNSLVDTWNDSLINNQKNHTIMDMERIINGVIENSGTGVNQENLGENLFHWYSAKLIKEKLCSQEKLTIITSKWNDLIECIKNSKKISIKKWEGFANDKWLDSIREINRKIPNKLPNYSILSHLASGNILEGTKTDCKFIAENILDFLNDNRDDIFELIQKDIYLLNEFLTDYYLCNLINLDSEIFNSMIKRNIQENSYFYSYREPIELEFRKYMLSETINGYEWMRETIDNAQIEIIEIYQDNLGFDRVKQYLKYLHENSKLSIDKISSKGIEYLRDYFKLISPEAIDSFPSYKADFDLNIDFIEALSTLSLEK